MREPACPEPATIRALAAQRDWKGIVAHVGEAPDDALLAELDVALHVADAWWRVGEPDRTLALADRIEQRLRPWDHQPLALDLLNIVGIALWESGRVAEAEARFGELLDRATDGQHDEFAARASNNLGMVANLRGDPQLALTYYERALASYQRLGYIRGLAQTHHNIGISYRDLGFSEDADTHYRRAIHFARASTSADVVALAETERAMLRARAGDGALAELLALRALMAFRNAGDPLGEGEALRALAFAALARRELELARERLDHALRIARSHQDRLLHAETQRDRGRVLHALGDHDGARAALLEALADFEALGAAPDVAATHALLAQLAA